MTLDDSERAVTSRELRADLEDSGVEAAVVAATLGFSAARLEATLEVSGSGDPADVWLLRDFLDRAASAEWPRTGPGARRHRHGRRR